MTTKKIPDTWPALVLEVRKATGNSQTLEENIYLYCEKSSISA